MHLEDDPDRRLSGGSKLRGPRTMRRTDSPGRQKDCQRCGNRLPADIERLQKFFWFLHMRSCNRHVSSTFVILWPRLQLYWVEQLLQ